MSRGYGRRRDYDQMERFGKGGFGKGEHMFGMAEGPEVMNSGPSLILLGPVPTQNLDGVPDGVPAYFGQFEPWSQIAVFRIPQTMPLVPADRLEKGEKSVTVPQGMYIARFCRITGTLMGDWDELLPPGAANGVVAAAGDVFEMGAAMQQAAQMAAATQQAAQMQGAMQMGPMGQVMPQMVQPAPVVYRTRTGVCVAKVINTDRFGFVKGQACRLWFA